MSCCDQARLMHAPAKCPPLKTPNKHALLNNIVARLLADLLAQGRREGDRGRDIQRRDADRQTHTHTHV